MSAVQLRITGPSFDAKTGAREAKRVLDSALRNHRRLYLPRHFRPEALALYPAAYENWKPSAAKKAKARAEIKAKIDRMDPARRAKFMADKRRKLADLALRYPEVAITAKRERKRKNPLVETGRARSAILHGHVDFTGPVARRGMTLSATPWYFMVTARSQGQVHDKVKAVLALAPDEQEAFVTHCDQKLAEWYGA